MLLNLKIDLHNHVPVQILLGLLFALSSIQLNAQTTYYSRDGGTSDWDLTTSWTLSSDGIGAPAGPPGQNDYVIILDGHTIEVDDVTDNGGPGQSANSLDLPNVGKGASYPSHYAFPDSYTANFFHNGEMTVEEGGTLIFSTRVMFDGTIFIAGTLTTSHDIIILGNLYFAPSASFSSTDDLICSGFSNTRIDIPTATNAWTSDDIYLDHTDAFVCGLGQLGIGRAGGTGHVVNLNNGATMSQICTVLDIVGCDPNPPLDSPCPSGTTVYNPSVPVLSGTGGSFNYVENSVEVIDNGIGVVYAEPLPYLTGATVTISTNYVDGEDMLTLPGISTIVAVFDSNTGTLNLSGYGTVSRWQTALQSITYENLSDNPTTTTRTVEFQVTDGFNPSNTISRDITITAVNDPPDVSTISGSPTPLAYAEGDGAVAIDNQIEVNDPDDTNLESATISLTNYVQGEDILDFADNYSITKVGFDIPTGVLTLTGTTTLANYELALRSVTYENLSDTPDLTTRTANFTVNDGDADSPQFGRDIEISATNDAPVASDDNVATDEDTDVDIDLSALVTDADNALDLTTIAITTSPTNGTISNINTTTGVVTYSPTADYNGGDTFGYTIDDVSGATSNEGTITLTINPVNDAPVATDDTAVTDEDTDVDIDLSALVTDIDNALDLTTIDITTGPTNGTISNINTTTGVVTYSPTTNYNGGDTFGYTIDDVSGGTSNEGTITLTINPTNDAPVASDDNVATDEDTDVDIDLSALVTDADNALDLTTIAITTGPTNGTISNINTTTGVVTYSPTADYNGGDSFGYTIDDVSSATSNEGTITLTINPVNDLPVATDDTTVTDEDTDVDIDLSALVTDIDNALDLTTIAITTGPTNGTISNINTTTGVVTYSPAANYNGGDTFGYTIDDVSGGTSNEGTITLTINPINDAPLASDDNVATDEDTDVDIDLSALVTDADNAVDLTTITITTGPTNGTISNINTTTGVVTYSPTADYNGGDSFGYTIDDVSSATSDEGTITLTINPVNDLPVATDDSAVTDEDTDVDIDLSALVTDIDDALDLTTIAITTGPTNGTISNINTTTGVVTYSPTADYNGGDTFGFTIDDISGGTSNIGTIALTVTAVNDVPVVSGTSGALNYTEGDGIVVIDNLVVLSDIDNTSMTTATISITSNFVSAEDLLHFSDMSGITGNYTNGVLTLTGVASIADYSNALSSVAYENTSADPNSAIRTIEFVVNDGAGTSNGFNRDINITVVNDPPTIAGTSAALTYTEGDGPIVLDNAIDLADVDNTNLASATISIATNFVDPEDILSFSNQNGISGNYSSGTLTLSGSATVENYQTALRSITYENDSEDPDSNTRTISITVNDGTDNSSSFTRDIMISPVNDVPILVGNTSALNYNEGDGPVAIDNALFISDVDNNNMASAIISISSNYTSTEDLLSFTNQAGITGSYSDGVLSLTGSAAINDYVLALRSVTYENTSPAPNSASRTIDFIVNDGMDNSLVFSREINVQPIIEPTVISLASGGSSLELTYTEGDGAVAINSGLMFTDPDDVNLEGVTVRFTQNYMEGEDVLEFTDQLGITGSFDPASGVLSLTGTASLADYEQAVTAITYANTSENPSNQDRILAENVFDGDVQSNTITITVSIIPVNDPPVVSMESSALLYVESSGAVAIDDQITVDDLDNDNLVSATIEISNNYTATEDRLDFADINGISGTFDNQSGVLNLSGQATVAEYQEALRQVTYSNINEQAFTGTRLIEVIVNDGLDNSSMVMREITIEEVIDPVVIYQLVTPDGDSMNDTWTIDGIEQYPNNIVQIYNRYNNLVYQQTSYENSLAPWSGQANQGITSGDLTDGTYFYTVDLGDGSNIFEGFLVLKRK